MGGGFAKGTPVHTRDGTMPIEAIRVGDEVLSAPDDGSGTATYKRVVHTFVHRQQTICKINTYAPEPATQYFVAATGDHRFWVEDNRKFGAPSRVWTRADELGRHTALRKADGTPAGVDSQRPVYRTEHPGVGWVPALFEVEGSHGARFDYENYDLVSPEQSGEYLPPGVLDSEDPFLRVTVYDLEVEDDHSYFAGVDGLWVHDAS